MSDSSGTTPGESGIPEEAAVPEETVIPPAADVIPPPPPEIPIPDGLLAPPSTVIPPASAVIPPPPEDTLRRSDRPRPTPAILEGEPPAAVADDWAKPSVAPEVPTTGGYGGIVIAIFAFLIVLLVVAVGLAIYLLNTSGLPFAGSDVAAVQQFALAQRL